nr:hypothetical protein [uncultured Flavobacterium sp.]
MKHIINDGFCPECHIGLNTREIQLKHCTNCKCDWEDETDEFENEIFQIIPSKMNFQDKEPQTDFNIR